MWPSMYPLNLRALQAEALFVSALQRSEKLRVSQIREAIAGILVAYGGAGCAGRVAQEFGDHPEISAVRMRWARATVAVRDGQSAPRIRRTAAADRSALATNPRRGSRRSGQRNPPWHAWRS
jgi:hypothetical protein